MFPWWNPSKFLLLESLYLSLKSPCLLVKSCAFPHALRLGPRWCSGEGAVGESSTCGRWTVVLTNRNWPSKIEGYMKHGENWVKHGICGLRHRKCWSSLIIIKHGGLNQGGMFFNEQCGFKPGKNCFTMKNMRCNNEHGWDIIGE